MLMYFPHFQEKMNQAITALFAEPQLPDAPMEYLAAHLCSDKLAKADASLQRMEQLEKEIKKLKSELRDLRA